ncbi:MAG: flagellar protein FliS [Desulfobulbaceae bacterium]|nr:flagellar protein FliS [Desulfobulbaceae bacterium]
MNSAQVKTACRQTEPQAQTDPVKLIHLIYERVIVHLLLAEEGVKTFDPRKRGENLGKAIALVTKLNALTKEDNTEAARFLRGLYGAILMELPKVSISGDIQILRQAMKYIERLKEIWEQTAMLEDGAPPRNVFNDYPQRLQ